MVIYVDVDGVLAQMVEAVIDRFNARHGSSWRAEDIVDWDFKPMLKSNQRWWDYTGDLVFWRSLELYPWAKQLLSAVISTGHEWAFLTSLPIEPYGVLQVRRNWIQEHFGGCDDKVAQRLVVAKRKDLVVHKGDKLIDDSEANIRAVEAVGAHGVLLAQPWNRKADFHRTSPDELIGHLALQRFLKEKGL